MQPFSIGLNARIWWHWNNRKCCQFRTWNRLESDMELSVAEKTYIVLKRIHSYTISARHGIIQFNINFIGPKIKWLKLIQICTRHVTGANERLLVSSKCSRHKIYTVQAIHSWVLPPWQLFEMIDSSSSSAICGIVPTDVHLNAAQANMLSYTTLLASRLILFK